jgi:RNA polymerase sigma-70 factor, ECF subfamily
VDQGPSRAPAPPTVESVPAGHDERELIAAVLRKDRKAAAQFVAAHIDAVYAYTRHRLMPRTETIDDVVQEVFLAALKGLQTFAGQSSVRTWLLAIARHKIEDIYRQRLRAAFTLDPESGGDEPIDDAMPLDEQIDGQRAREKARRVLNAMPERYAVLLLWRYWEQRTTREMAEAVGTTEKGVERMLARARATFKSLWVKE